MMESSRGGGPGLYRQRRQVQCTPCRARMRHNKVMHNAARQPDTTSWIVLGNHHSAQAIFRSGDLFQAERRQRHDLQEGFDRLGGAAVVR